MKLLFQIDKIHYLNIQVLPHTLAFILKIIRMELKIGFIKKDVIFVFTTMMMILIIMMIIVIIIISRINSGFMGVKKMSRA